MSPDFDSSAHGFTDNPELQELIAPYVLKDFEGVLTFEGVPAPVAGQILDLIPEWNQDLAADAPPVRDLVAVALEIEGAELGGHLVPASRDDERVTFNSISVPGEAADVLRARLGGWAAVAYDPATAFEPGEIPDEAMWQPSDDLTLWWD